MAAGRPSLDWLLKTRYSDHFEPLVGWEAGTCCRNDGMLQSLLSFTFFLPGVKSFVSIELKSSPCAGCWVLPGSSVLGVPPSTPFQQDIRFEPLRSRECRSVCTYWAGYSFFLRSCTVVLHFGPNMIQICEERWAGTLRG